MSERRELRSIFGLKREDMTEGLIKLYEELHNLYCFAKYYCSDQIRGGQAR